MVRTCLSVPIFLFKKEQPYNLLVLFPLQRSEKVAWEENPLPGRELSRRYISLESEKSAKGSPWSSVENDMGQVFIPPICSGDNEVPLAAESLKTATNKSVSKPHLHLMLSFCFNI